MRCCVPNCKNDSRHISKLQGITFHVFPTETSLRTAWLKAVGKEGWVPKERSAVCSEHFLTDDLYETKNGLRRVRVGAVPIILQDSNTIDFGETSSLQVCRICLNSESRLYPIKNYKLEHVYQQLTGLCMEDNDRLPQKLCTECIARLINYRGFRNKSLRSHSLMIGILNKHNNISLQSIKMINRENNQLNTSLVKKHFDSSHYNLLIDATDEDNVKFVRSAESLNIQQINLDMFNVEIDVKEENDNTGAFPEQIEANDLNDTIDADSQSHNDTDIDNDKNDLVNNTDDVLKKEDTDSDPNYEADLKPDLDSDDEVIKVPKKLIKRRRRKIERKSNIALKKLKARKVVKRDPNEPKIDRRRRPFLNDDLNETLFTIKNLSFDEQLAEIKKRRESTNFKNSTYKCMNCFKGFLDEDAYNSHSLRHTDQCGEFECDICKTHFKHHHALRKHITAHHTQRFSCNSCPYITTHRQTARLHERWHKGTKYHCPHCSDEFVKFTTYMGHIRIKHPSDFVCELCGYSFVSEKGIELHKKLKHRLEDVTIPPDGPYCEVCNVKFISIEAHKQHLRVSARHMDTSLKEPKEPKERNKNKKPRDLKQRKPRDKKPKESDEPRKVYPSQIRKAEGPIPCEQCGLQLEDSRAYHGHFRRMHPDKNRTNYPSMRSPCMCEICGKIFQSYALLKDHRYVHTGEKPFKCDECSKSFRMKQRLTAHKRVHAKVKSTYVCGVCGKGFSTHSNRQRHMFIHTGLKPFKCEMCGKCFKHSSEKRAHITYVHLKKPWPKRQRANRKKMDYEREEQLDMEAAGVREMDVQAIWPTCSDPKLSHLNPMMDDKPMYL